MFFSAQHREPFPEDDWLLIKEYCPNKLLILHIYIRSRARFKPRDALPDPKLQYRFHDQKASDCLNCKDLLTTAKL